MSIFEEVQTHLGALEADPSLKIDTKLLDIFATQITDQTDRHIIDTFLNKISKLILFLQQDPTPLTNLAIKLTNVPSFTFKDVLSIQPPLDFVAGLTIATQPINLVILSLLKKATLNPSDIAIVANKADVVVALIQLWLRTPFTYVAQTALEVIWTFLEVDHRSNALGSQKANIESSQRLMWRRIFKDKEIYSSIYSICSLKTVGQEGQLGKQEKSLAQARLMDLLPRLGKIDWEMIFHSQFPEVESHYGLPSGSGLLYFAAASMVDSDDILMQITLLDFFTKLVGLFSIDDSLPESSQQHHLIPLKASSPSLDFLISNGLHDRAISIILEPDKHDSLEVEFLGSSAVKYLAMYSSCYPNHVLESSDVSKTLSRLSYSLTLSSGQWAHGQIPKHMLHLISSLPRAVLWPSRNVSMNLLFKLPSRPPNADAYLTLGTIFHGPDNLGQDSEGSTSLTPEASAAKALYYAYLKRNPDFWKDVVASADTVALKDTALAAISLIRAVITANWAELPQGSSGRFPLPTEEELANFAIPNTGIAPSGVVAILSPPALESVLPFLMKPPQTFSNLVGGGRGDVESAAWQIASQKFDTLVSLYHKLKDAPNIAGQELGPIVDAIKQRLTQGPWSSNAGVGGNVGTLEL
ncbi:MAG: hypothetical protein M1834_004568 [Cirrosporium novae-zelandiae]|nr:MAG: hypothetical protein M1834_004568 [Cirrosporium novae-zelandiae]